MPVDLENAAAGKKQRKGKSVAPAPAPHDSSSSRDWAKGPTYEQGNATEYQRKEAMEKGDEAWVASLGILGDKVKQARENTDSLLHAVEEFCGALDTAEKPLTPGALQNCVKIVKAVIDTMRKAKQPPPTVFVGAADGHNHRITAPFFVHLDDLTRWLRKHPVSDEEIKAGSSSSSKTKRSRTQKALLGIAGAVAVGYAGWSGWS